MTLTQLMFYCDLLYPTPTDQRVRTMYINEAIGLLNPLFDSEHTASIETVEDQDEYSLPTGIDDVSQIISLGVSRNETAEDKYDYYTYVPSMKGNYPNRYRSYYQLVDDDGNKTLVIYPAPTQDGYEISIRYKKDLYQFDLDITDYDTPDTDEREKSPDFDEKYHYLLAYYTCAKIASSGHAPDTLQADMFTSVWENGLREIRREQMRRKIKRPTSPRDNPQWHRPDGHVHG